MDNCWERRFLEYFQGLEGQSDDASHDLGHFRRVARIAQDIGSHEAVAPDGDVLMAAAYFHDIVSLPKNHPDSCRSSHYAAHRACELLVSMGFPESKLDAVFHAIEAHSFSAQISPKTAEAMIIQDADRMEALGALGIMRCFYISGRLGRSCYHATDPLAEGRPLDDKNYGLDHFYCKLFKLPDLLQTEGGRQIAHQRTAFLEEFVGELLIDIKRGGGHALLLANECREAGAKGRQFFHPTDLSAKCRVLDPETYVLDRLMPVCTGFMDRFICQLQQETLA